MDLYIFDQLVEAADATVCSSETYFRRSYSVS